MRFTEIQHGSPEYQMECELRQAILRVPLGLSLDDEDLGGESRQRHFGLFLTDESLAACAIAVAISRDEMKIRQVAVRTDFQGLGYGRMLMTMLENQLAQSGIRHLSCHARINVVGFYESLGFEKSGGEFSEVGIPHVKMEKSLERRV